MQAAKVARFPGAPGRIPNFTGAERAADDHESVIDEGILAWRERGYGVRGGAKP